MEEEPTPEAKRISERNEARLVKGREFVEGLSEEDRKILYEIVRLPDTHAGKELKELERKYGQKFHELEEGIYNLTKELNDTGYHALKSVFRGILEEN